MFSPSNYYRPMSDNKDEENLANFTQWDEKQLGLFFRRRGLGSYEQILLDHKITGHLAPLLQDQDLKDMGITIVGDRLLFQRSLKELARRERFHKRIESIWEGEERVFFSTCGQRFWTLFGFCPVDPSTYKLTTNHLKVKQVRPYRCGPVRMGYCCGASYTSNNIDLSKVDDVDVTGVPAPCVARVCCCARGKELLEVESRFEKGGKVTMSLEKGQGEIVANLILNQVEESQKMERS